MKTRFDNITESPERLAFWFSCGRKCTVCANAIDNNGIMECADNSKSCSKEIVKWLKQPLPMNEQFSDEDIKKAQELKQDGWNWVAREKDYKRCNVYEHKPFRTFDDMYGNYWQNKGYSKEVKQEYFKFIKWEDEPILLDDIINSRGKK